MLWIGRLGSLVRLGGGGVGYRVVAGLLPFAAVGNGLGLRLVMFFGLGREGSASAGESPGLRSVGDGCLERDGLGLGIFGEC